MKILAINASHRGDKGYTRYLLDLLGEGAMEAGAAYEVVTLARLRLNRCLACDACQRDVRLPIDPQTFSSHCVWDAKDDVRAVFDKMIAADLLIYATPVQVFGISSLMKTFLDRLYAAGNASELCVADSGLLFHFVDHRVASKPFVSLVCCDNLEAETPKSAIEYFRTFSRFMDAPLAGELVRNGGVLVGHGRDPEASQRFPRIRDIYAAYQEAGRDLACCGRIRRSTQRQANQEIIPVPFFSILKRLRLRAVKQEFLRQAEKMGLMS
jgi:multimeric flavodoxin WrbA